MSVRKEYLLDEPEEAVLEDNDSGDEACWVCHAPLGALELENEMTECLRCQTT